MNMIDRDALVAEIDERIKTWKEYYDDMNNAECHELASGAYLRMCELKDFKKFLDTLEVKEVGLESEMDKYFETMEVLEHENIFEDTFQRIAKHFFELGLKAKQE